MVKQQHRKPTKAEFEILMILWKHSEAVTVREVFEAVNEQKYASYTTVLKLLQIMHEKGLVERDEQNRAHRYRAKIKQKETGKRMLDEVLQKIFGGSASRLVQQVLEAETTSAEDMREIRKMIERAEKGAKQK